MYFRKVWMFICLLSILAGSAGCGAGGNGPQAAKEGTAGKAGEENRQTGPWPAQVSYVGDQQWGYIDDTGAFVIKPVFSEAREFQANGLAVAGKEGKVGVIDRTGKFIVSPVYDNISGFSDGVAVANSNKGFYVLNEKGKVVYESDDYIGTFKEGRAPIEAKVADNKLLYGYIDTAGNMVIPPRFRYVTDFDDGRAVVGLDAGGYAIIDKEGRVIKKLDYSLVFQLSEGLAGYSPTQDSKMGYLDANGNVAISPAYSEVQSFKDGTAVVNGSEDVVNRKYGVIDKKGKYVIKPEYNDALILGEGMYAVGKALNPKEPLIGSKYAITDKTGKLLTDYYFYGVEDFREGYASVNDRDSTYFIDRSGRRVPNLPSVKGIGTMKLLNNLVSAYIDNRLFYLDRSGNIVYKPADYTTLKNGITVAEVKYSPNRNYLVYIPRLGGIADKAVETSVNDRLRKMSITADVTPDMDLDYNYNGGFNIEFYRKNLVELELWCYNFPFGAAHGMPTKVYVPVDVKTGRFYELKDLFKEDSDYVKVLSEIVRKQIALHGDEMGVWPDSYKGIAPDQPFYVTAEALKLYFLPYEIAPYAAGFPTFTIPYAEISDIIDKKGAFWKSFH